MAREIALKTRPNPFGSSRSHCFRSPKKAARAARFSGPKQNGADILIGAASPQSTRRMGRLRDRLVFSSGGHGPDQGVSRGNQRGTFALKVANSSPNELPSEGSSTARTQTWKNSQRIAA